MASFCFHWRLENLSTILQFYKSKYEFIKFFFNELLLLRNVCEIRMFISLLHSTDACILLNKCAFLFKKLIPDYSLHIHPNVPLPPIHTDILVTDHLLKLIISYRWRPIINNTLQSELSQWLKNPPESPQPDADYPPSLIFLGEC